MKLASPPSQQAGVTPEAHTRPTLDIQDGLARIMGDRTLYFKLLRRFLYDNQSLLTQLRSAIEGGRYPFAQMKVHSLKSAAGMIGAHALHERATALESALRAQAPSMEQPLQQLDTALNKVLAVIPGVLPELSDVNVAPVEAAPRPADAATLVLLQRLAGHLREGDGAALDILASSASVLAACLGLARYQQVAAAAHEFDFDTALKALLTQA